MINFICFSQNNWEKRKARKQQIMLHLSKREDVGKVLYVEPPLNFWRLLFYPFNELNDEENRRRWKRAICFSAEALTDKLILFTPIFFIPFSFRFQFIYNLNRLISLFIINIKLRKLRFKRNVLWLYHPFDYMLLRWFKDRALSVFDWAEDWAEYSVELDDKRRKETQMLEDKIAWDADIVCVVSRKLLERAKRLNGNSHQVLDGTNAEMFLNYAEDMPNDLGKIPRPIVAFVGTVYKRVDHDLLRLLSEKMPDCSIVLIGSVFDPPETVAKIAARKNIFCLGVKEYSQLPGYMLNCDVFILPYIPELVASPATKIYDYLATGKPIVTTDLVEMDAFGDCIRIAKGNNEFIDLVRASLQENSIDMQNKRKEMAKRNSWDLRVQEIMEIIQT